MMTKADVAPLGEHGVVKAADSPNQIRPKCTHQKRVDFVNDSQQSLTRMIRSWLILACDVLQHLYCA